MVVTFQYDLRCRRSSVISDDLTGDDSFIFSEIEFLIKDHTPTIVHNKKRIGGRVGLLEQNIATGAINKQCDRCNGYRVPGDLRRLKIDGEPVGVYCVPCIDLAVLDWAAKKEKGERQ